MEQWKVPRTYKTEQGPWKENTEALPSAMYFLLFIIDNGTRCLLCIVKIWVDVLSVGRRKVISQYEIICEKSGDNRTPPPATRRQLSHIPVVASWPIFNIQYLSMWFYITCANASILNLLKFLPITNNANWQRRDNVCKIDVNVHLVLQSPLPRMFRSW